MDTNQDTITMNYTTWSQDVMRATQYVLRESKPAFVTGISSETLEKLFRAGYGVFQAANWIIREEPTSITNAID